MPPSVAAKGGGNRRCHAVEPSFRSPRCPMDQAASPATQAFASAWRRCGTTLSAADSAAHMFASGARGRSRGRRSPSCGPRPRAGSRPRGWAELIAHGSSSSCKVSCSTSAASRLTSATESTAAEALRRVKERHTGRGRPWRTRMHQKPQRKAWPRQPPAAAVPPHAARAVAPEQRFCLVLW